MRSSWQSLCSPQKIERQTPACCDHCDLHPFVWWVWVIWQYINVTEHNYIIHIYITIYIYCIYIFVYIYIYIYIYGVFTKGQWSDILSFNAHKMRMRSGNVAKHGLSNRRKHASGRPPKLHSCRIARMETVPITHNPTNMELCLVVAATMNRSSSVTCIHVKTIIDELNRRDPAM